ncbi:MAG: hypothetical protein ACI8PZ_003382 [Myxococcota bacterium]
MSDTGGSTETWLELGMNVVAPTAVLLLLSGADRLGPSAALVLALAFPVAHGLRALARSETISPFTVLALISVGLTGGIGLLELDVAWFAWKEAALPSVMGVLALWTARGDRPAMTMLLERLVDGDKTEAALDTEEKQAAWIRHSARATLGLGAMYLASGVASFALARWLVTSPTGTEGFNVELGQMTAASFPAIGVPTMIGTAVILFLFNAGLKRDVGVQIDDLLR